MKIIKDKGFAIVNSGIILPFTIRSTRKQCIEHRERDIKFSWAELKKQGERCVKVLIQTAPATDTGKE